jgi:hypothetical protein
MGGIRAFHHPYRTLVVKEPSRITGLISVPKSLTANPVSFIPLLFQDVKHQPKKILYLGFGLFSGLMLPSVLILIMRSVSAIMFLF